MFTRLCESGRAYARPPLAPVAVSAIANVVAMYGAAVATRPPDPNEPLPVAPSEVVYLLPLPPSPPPVDAVGVVWAPGGKTGAGRQEAATDSAGSGRAGGSGGETGTGRGRRGRKKAVDTTTVVTAPPNPFEGGNVYIASELDHPVTFDPTSAGPEYPEALKTRGVEGYARIRFVVDTTGFADPATVQEIDVTHPLFASAVRNALPRMHFRPAELADRRVRQLVEQQFKFVMAPTTPVPPADSGRARTADSTRADSAIDGATGLTASIKQPRIAP